MPTPTIDTGAEERANLPSASSMDRLANCPGSRAACKGLTELPTSQAAETGVNVHGAMETDDDSGLELTEQEIVDKMRPEVERAVEDWRANYAFPASNPGTVLKEERMWIRNRVTLDPIASARLDFAIVCGDHAMAIDFKTGFKPTTPSERNWQVRTQVLCLWHTYPNLKTVRGAILASRLHTSFDCTDHTLDDMRTIEKELKHVLWRAGEPGASRVPGSHCRYCTAAGLCPQSVVYSLVDSYRQRPMTDGKPDGLAVAQATELLDPAQLAYVHEREAIAKAVFDSIEARMKMLPADVLRSIGYELVPGNLNKKIVNVPVAFNRLGAVLTPDERMACVKLSRTPAAKILAAKAKLAGQKLTLDKAADQILEILGDSIVETPGQPKLNRL